MLSRSSVRCGRPMGGLVVALVLSAVGAAQELEISVSPSPVGSGARAAGMADAFVAIADDATAASWNPAGLVQLERPELSLVGSYTALAEELDSTMHEEVKSSHLSGSLDLNYLSFVYPLPMTLLGRNAVVSLNYQRKYDFTRKFRINLNTSSVASNGVVNNSLQIVSFEQTGGLSTLTPAFAVEITPRLSVGAALNLWRSSPLSENSWEQESDFSAVSLIGETVYWRNVHRTRKYDDFSAENATLGLLWNPTSEWSLGIRYDTGFTGEAGFNGVDLRTRVTLPSFEFPFASSRRSFLSATPAIQDERREITFPDSAAVGVAWRPTDRLTLSLDVTRTDWNDFYVKDANGVRHSLVDFSNLDDPFQRSHFKPCYTVRLGTEYVFIPKTPHEKLSQLWTLRGGLFYDPEPAAGKSDNADDRGSGTPDSFYGAAVGVGLQLHQRVNLDLAYQCRYGHDVNKDFIRGIKGFSEDVLQHRVLLSTVIYF